MLQLKRFLEALLLGMAMTIGVLAALPAYATGISNCGSNCYTKSDCQGCCDNACCPNHDSCDNQGNQTCYGTCP